MVPVDPAVPAQSKLALLVPVVQVRLKLVLLVPADLVDPVLSKPVLLVPAIPVDPLRPDHLRPDDNGAFDKIYYRRIKMHVNSLHR